MLDLYVNGNIAFIILYRPFSSDQRINTIDTRTYFYLYDFIEKSHSGGTDLALVTTWVSLTLLTLDIALPVRENTFFILFSSSWVSCRTDEVSDLSETKNFHN